MITDTLKIKEKYEKVESSYTKLDFPNSMAIQYHESSKLTPLTSRMFGMNVASFNHPYFHKMASQPFKIYPGKEIISFKEFFGQHLPQANLFEIILKRQSRRNYIEHNMSLKELYYLLHFSYGTTRVATIREVDEGCWYYRAVPSGGALYPLEIYPIIFTGSDVKPGLYHYRPDKGGIEFLKEGMFNEELIKIITAEPYVQMKKASAVFLITSVVQRTMLKYKDRGYRFILMEAGFASEHLSLIAESIGLGSCMIGGFIDDAVNDFLEIDGLTETILNVIVVGEENTEEKSDLYI